MFACAAFVCCSPHFVCKQQLIVEPSLLAQLGRFFVLTPAFDKIKHPQGVFEFYGGAYRTRTYGPLRHGHGLAIRCITTLPTLQLGVLYINHLSNARMFFVFYKKNHKKDEKPIDKSVFFYYITIILVP